MRSAEPGQRAKATDQTPEVAKQRAITHVERPLEFVATKAEAGKAKGGSGKTSTPSPRGKGRGVTGGARRLHLSQCPARNLGPARHSKFRIHTFRARPSRVAAKSVIAPIAIRPKRFIDGSGSARLGAWPQAAELGFVHSDQTGENVTNFQGPLPAEVGRLLAEGFKAGKKSGTVQRAAS